MLGDDNRKEASKPIQATAINDSEEITGQFFCGPLAVPATSPLALIALPTPTETRTYLKISKVPK